jgi:hypothetical protein
MDRSVAGFANHRPRSTIRRRVHRLISWTTARLMPEPYGESVSPSAHRNIAQPGEMARLCDGELVDEEGFGISVWPRSTDDATPGAARASIGTGA